MERDEGAEDPEVFGSTGGVVIPGFSAAAHRPPSEVFPVSVLYVRRPDTYSNVSCQPGIIPGSGRRYGQETRSNPIPSPCRSEGDDGRREEDDDAVAVNTARNAAGLRADIPTTPRLGDPTSPPLPPCSPDFTRSV